MTPAAEAVEAMQLTIAAVDRLFVTKEIRPGEFMHLATGTDEMAIAKALLPMLSATHLGRLIRTHRELILEYR